VEWIHPEGYRLSDDPELIDLRFVAAWLREQSYWATGRTPETIARAISQSLCFSLLGLDGNQIGFARFATDRATFAWLCDVFVAEPHQRHGLGSWMIANAISHPDVAASRLVLGTADAQGFYAKFGFQPFGEWELKRWMVRPAPSN
jgi:GNAT superfamily N-acetyltransferase